MDFTNFLLQNDVWWRFIHIAGAIIAMGSVVFADLLLLSLKIKPAQASLVAKISPLLSLQVWIGIFLLSFSGLLLYLPRVGLGEYPLFQLKMFLVLLIFLNGIFLNVWITPKFESLVPEWGQKTSAIRKFTVVAGVSSAVSFLSWWSVIIIMTIFY